jgi:hypothetical protein
VTDLIASLGQKISERWLGAIVLPGLLYTTIVGWALLAGHWHALDLPWLVGRVDELWHQAPPRPATAAITIAAALALAGSAGVASTVMAEDILHRAWTIRGPQRWLNTLRKRTRARWVGRDSQPPERYLPQRATIIGECFRLIGERVHAQYGLSVNDAWPRIWILASADTRTLLAAAQQRYYGDAALAAWGLLYLPWTLWWWPAGIIAATTIALGYLRARTSATTLATFIEATVDVHATDLAGAVGVDLPEGRVTPVEGNNINDILIKRA